MSVKRPTGRPRGVGAYPRQGPRSSCQGRWRHAMATWRSITAITGLQVQGDEDSQEEQQKRSENEARHLVILVWLAS